MLQQMEMACTTDGKVSVGAFRSATSGNNNNSSFWLSPSGDYAFGFRQLEQDKDMFLLSVWYVKIPDLTVVWYAYGENSSPAIAPKGSVLNLTASSGLVLTDPHGQQLWNTSCVGDVAFGVFNDTGNFVLEDNNSQSLWETFKNTTHTMLPGQVIEIGGKISSQQSETNYSKGRFQLRFLYDGNVEMNTLNLPTEFANEPYYVSGTNDSLNSSNSCKQLVFNSSGYLYVLRENGEKFNITKTVSTRNNYRRVTLGFDGVLSQYWYPKDPTSNAKWTVHWSRPKNICNMIVGPGPGDGLLFSKSRLSPSFTSLFSPKLT